METWLPTLITPTPQQGYDLAIQLSRMAIKLIQPDAVVRQNLRPSDAKNADSLTMAAEVVARNFQTVAAANNFWRTEEELDINAISEVFR